MTFRDLKILGAALVIVGGCAVIVTNPTSPQAYAAAVLADAGVDAGRDAGTPDAGASSAEQLQRQVVFRRDLLRTLVALMIENLQKENEIVLEEILFSEQIRENHDSAVILYKMNGKKAANFFFFTGEEWKLFPADYFGQP